MKAAFTPEGEPLVCGTWSGSNGDRQDVIIHCVEGGDYPVLDGDFGEHKRTGDLLPPLTKLGVAAASGVMRYRGDAFPADYHGNLFSALFNMHKVVRHVVERDGATFSGPRRGLPGLGRGRFPPHRRPRGRRRQPPGRRHRSWFSHCPTSESAKPESRAASTESRVGADPRGRSAGPDDDWARLDPRALTRRLDDPRFAVRDRAVEEWCAAGSPVRSAFSTPYSATTQRRPVRRQRGLGPGPDRGPRRSRRGGSRPRRSGRECAAHGHDRGRAPSRLDRASPD